MFLFCYKVAVIAQSISEEEKKKYLKMISDGNSSDNDDKSAGKNCENKVLSNIGC